MRVFLSWSGDLSKQVSLALRDWLPLVVQAVEPYMSAEDIDKGARWGNEIAAELEACDFGIICLTPNNLQAPWIYFEAGALSKAVERARVSPLLLGLKPSDVTGPLVQFQFTLPQRPDMLRLVSAINDACGERGLDVVRLERMFSTMWPQLEAELHKLDSELSTAATTSRKRGTVELLEELLGLVRSQTRLLTERVNPPPIVSEPTPEELLAQEGRLRRINVVRRTLGIPRSPPFLIRHLEKRILVMVPENFEVNEARLAELRSLPELADFEITFRRRVMRENPND